MEILNFNKVKFSSLFIFKKEFKLIKRLHNKSNDIVGSKKYNNCKQTPFTGN